MPKITCVQQTDSLNQAPGELLAERGNWFCCLEIPNTSNSLDLSRLLQNAGLGSIYFVMQNSQSNQCSAFTPTSHHLSKIPIVSPLTPSLCTKGGNQRAF
jgi:hypothetical protein